MTPHVTDDMRAYGDRMFQQTPPTRSEMTRLFLALEAGDPHARAEIIERNLRLVHTGIRRFLNTSGFVYEDAAQVGTIGLINAVDTFDVHRGWTFATYATRCIWREVQKEYLVRRFAIKKPTNSWSMESAIRDARNKLGEHATDQEIADHTRLGVSVVTGLIETSRPIYSLDIPIEDRRSADADSMTFSDLLVAPQNNPDEEDPLAPLIENAVDNLPNPHASVIRLLYGLNSDGYSRGHASTAKRFNRGIEWVRRIETEALEMLRQAVA